MEKPSPRQKSQISSSKGNFHHHGRLPSVVNRSPVGRSDGGVKDRRAEWGRKEGGGGRRGGGRRRDGRRRGGGADGGGGGGRRVDGGEGEDGGVRIGWRGGGDGERGGGRDGGMDGQSVSISCTFRAHFKHAKQKSEITVFNYVHFHEPAMQCHLVL